MAATHASAQAQSIVDRMAKLPFDELRKIERLLDAFIAKDEGTATDADLATIADARRQVADRYPQ
jgi:hypothetical protein